MIGERIRELRQTQGRSLADVAGKAKISVATLSRIENDKQSVDLSIFLTLAKVLEVPAQELLDGIDGHGKPDGDPLAQRIARLETKKRAELWRDLAAERRSSRGKDRTAATRDVSQQVDELLAQIDFLREELDLVRKRVKKR